MDKTQRMIILLLIFAIVFSAVSLFIGFSAFNFDISRGNSPNDASASGGERGVINLYVKPSARSNIGSEG